MYKWTLMAENRHKESIDSTTKTWALLAGVCVSPLFFLFAYFGDPGRGRAAFVCATGIAVATRFLWDLRRRVWFWDNNSDCRSSSRTRYFIHPLGEPAAYICRLVAGRSFRFCHYVRNHQAGRECDGEKPIRKSGGRTEPIINLRTRRGQAGPSLMGI